MTSRIKLGSVVGSVIQANGMLQSPKFQKSMFLVTSVIGIKYLYADRAQNFFSKMLRFRRQGYQIQALLKVDEEFQISDTS